MKVLVAVLVMLLLMLQYRLWFGTGSLQEVSRLRNEASASRAELIRLNTRNKALAAEVADLKRGLDAIEERARADLGMISQGETFYQFVLEAGEKSSGSGDPVPDTPTSDTRISE
ncbi:MAG: cell division protein FtsB [Granulosicoccus sp.]